MNIHAKIFLQTALILVIVLFFGSLAYFKSIDAIFKNQIDSDMARDNKIIQSHIAQKKVEIEKIALNIGANESIKASLNLISNYEDRKNYQPLIFDVQKRIYYKQRKSI